MTNKEAIEELKKVDTLDMPARLCEAYHMSIKALEQEPSGDAISRQAVIDVIDKWVKNMGVLIALPTSEATPLFESIYELPPVNPQEPNTGHWEWLTEDKYRCSNCNHETRVDECMNEPMYDFCPFCGTRMESEVSE